MLRKSLLSAVALMSLGLASVPAMATVMTYSDSTSFMSAVTPQATVGFNGIAPAGSYTVESSNSSTTPWVHSGLGFLDNASINGGYTNGGVAVYSKTLNNFAAGAYFNSDYLSFTNTNNAEGSVSLPGSEHYLGFYIFDVGLQAKSFATIINGITYNVAETAGTPAYFGIYSSDAITSFTVANTLNEANIELNNISYSNSTTPPPPPPTSNDSGTSVPEPGMLGLMGVSFLALVGFARISSRRMVSALPDLA